MTPDDIRDRLSADPSSTVLLFDFDGTLAPIVDDPDAAVAAPGALDLLDRLAQRFRRVAVVSGRDVSFLARQMGADVDLSGLYGLQTRIGGVVTEHEDASRWRTVIDDVIAAADAPPGVRIEGKGLSLTAHFRTAPDAAGDTLAWAATTAGRTGLRARPAKASVELHPPIHASKGTAVHDLAGDAATVVYVGDDLGDLPAFAALDELALAGRTTVKVASGGGELPVEVADVADLVVDGPAAVVALFQPLVAASA